MRREAREKRRQRRRRGLQSENTARRMLQRFSFNFLGERRGGGGLQGSGTHPRAGSVEEFNLSAQVFYYV